MLDISIKQLFCKKDNVMNIFILILNFFTIQFIAVLKKFLILPNRSIQYRQTFAQSQTFQYEIDTW